MIWRIEVEDREGAFRHVVLDGSPDTPIADLIAQLDQLGFRGPYFFRGSDVGDSGSLATLGLKDGDRVRAGAPSIDSTAQRPLHDRYLVCVSGPDTGRYWSINTGESVIGRGNEANILIDDPYISRSHALVTLDESGRLWLTDRSANGTVVEQRPVGEKPEEVTTGDYIQVGSSILTCKDGRGIDRAPLLTEPGPTYKFQCQFRAAEAAPSLLQKAPQAPTVSRPAGSPWWQAMLPAVAGLAIAVQRGNYMFLMIALLSPAAFAAISFQRKKKQRQEYRQAAAKYLIDKRNYDAHVAETLLVETRQRRERLNGPGSAFFHGQVRSDRIWERRVSDSDFLSATIGMAADMPATLKVPDENPTLWMAPVEHNFLETGSLSLIGPASATQAALRSLVLDLCVAHTPMDLRIWIFSDVADGHGWEFVQWLPHAQIDGPRVALALTNDDRRKQFQALKQQLDTRLERHETGTKRAMFPVHLAVFDRATLLPESEINLLFSMGHLVSMPAIVADPEITPQGTNAKLALGEASDQATFRSTDHPVVNDVALGHVRPETAIAVARSLCPLRPALGAGSSIPSLINLVDLVDEANLTGEELAARWTSTTSTTRSTVGVTAESVVEIDIVRHGLHGLVGGMSGSGKTEFLMTYLTSLCLNNHPEDLAVVIVDFKGGLDHELSAQLPHVVSLSTNLNIESFKRTIDLLRAEQDRRQDFLAGGYPSLDAYHAARVRNPSLPPLPRLLVIVDEFSKLTATQEGKENLQELVNVTSIGRALGIHLMLVTQSFEGRLPGDIETNAGLRVCLRVTKDSDSKVLLKSPVAATISDLTIGRAYARLNSPDLVEFQTARVAGERRTGNDQDTPSCRATLAPPASLATLAINHPDQEQRPDQTDMHHLIDVMSDAAQRVGITRPPIPWPPELKAELGVDWLQGITPSFDRFIVGAQDWPAQQRHIPLLWSERDEQVLFLGGSTAQLPRTLISLGFAIASQTNPGEHHIHAIDPRGTGLGRLAELPHCGTVATRDDRLAGRILNELIDEAGERKVLMMRHNVATLPELEAVMQQQFARIYLLVADADRMARINDDSWQLTQAGLFRLVAENLGSGIRVVLAGDQRLADSRLGSGFDRRFVFALPPDTNPSSYGVPRALTTDLHLQGRAVDVNKKLLTQFIQTDHATPEAMKAEPNGPRPTALTTVRYPFPLSAVSLEDVPADFDAPLAVAVSTESGEWCWVDVAEDGPLFSITGGPRSGRSTALATIGEIAAKLGYRVVVTSGSRRSALWKAANDGLDWVWTTCSPADLVKTVMTNTNERIVVLIDDIQRFDEQHYEFEAIFDGDRVAAFFTATNDILESRVLRSLPTVRAGLMLQLSSPRDGSALGARTVPQDMIADLRPGQGLVIIDGQPTAAQVLLPETDLN